MWNRRPAKLWRGYVEQKYGAAAFRTSQPATRPIRAAPYTWVASGDGASSNPLPIFIHPGGDEVWFSVLYQRTVSTIRRQNCSPAAFTTQTSTCTDRCGDRLLARRLCDHERSDLNERLCVSQSLTSQLAARVYQNSSTTLANNISCKVGHLSYVAQAPIGGDNRPETA